MHEWISNVQELDFIILPGFFQWNAIKTGVGEAVYMLRIKYLDIKHLKGITIAHTNLL